MRGKGKGKGGERTRERETDTVRDGGMVGWKGKGKVKRKTSISGLVQKSTCVGVPCFEERAGLSSVQHILFVPRPTRHNSQVTNTPRISRKGKEAEGKRKQTSTSHRKADRKTPPCTKTRQ